MPWTGKKYGLLQKLTPSITFQVNPQISKTLSLLAKDARIADLGAGGRKITDKTICVDRIIFPGTDIKADLHSIPLKGEEFDAVFCTGTLEHVCDPYKVMEEAVRILKKGGIIHIEVPFMQPYHPDPEDYWRWTLEGIKLFCKKFGLEEVSSGVHMGPASAFTWITDQYILSFIEGTNKFSKLFRSILNTFNSLILWPFKFTDLYLIHKKTSKNISSAVFFVGRKKDSRINSKK